MLKKYLDDRMRRFAKGDLTKLPDSWAGLDAKLVWSALRSMFIETQDTAMYKDITIKLFITSYGDVYYAKGYFFHKLINQNIHSPGNAIKLISQLATDDEIVVTCKNNQTVFIKEGDCLIASLKGKVVYEFSYIPTQFSNDKE